MNKLILSAVALMLWSGVLYAQDEPASITETMYILPKRNMNEQLEAALKAHNDKFHKEDPHYAAVRTVDYGKMAGWYVWIMRGTYASLDSRPAKGAHDDDWSKNVDPLIEEYGDVGLWQYNAGLSTGMDIFAKSKKYQVWAVDIKTGKYDRFKALIARIKKSFESMGNRAFLVYNNAVPSTGTADVALIWSFDNFADLDGDWGTKEAYEKIYGEGTWDGMVAEWQSIIHGYDTELRSIR